MPAPPAKPLETRVHDYLRELKSRAGGRGLSRIEGFFDNLLGKSRARVEDPRQRGGEAGPLWVPGLPARPWHDPARLPWLREVAAARAELLAEARALLEGGLLVPSVEGRKDLEYKGWVTFDLTTIDLDVRPDSFRAEVATFPENRGRAPRAAKLIAGLPLVGDCFYSVLKPGGVVKPHFSYFNAKLICHLGLSVPRDCGIRVGGEVRSWRDGEFLLFDDTYTHDTWNRSAEPRVLFHMGVWHPDLTALEVSAIEGWFARSAPPPRPEARQ